MKTKLVIKEEEELDKDDILYAILTEKLEMFSSCYTIIISGLGFMITMTIGDYTDLHLANLLPKHSAPAETILLMGVLCVIHVVYSMMASKIEAELQVLEDSDSDSGEVNRESNTENTTLSVLGSAVLNFLGGTTMICAGGACNSVYISTLS